MKILFVVEHFPCLSETFVLNQVTGLLELGHDVTVCAVGKPAGAATHPDIDKYKLLARTWQGASVPTRKSARLLGALRKFPALLKRCGLRSLLAFNFLRHGKDAVNLKFFYSCLPLLARQERFDAIHCHFGDKGLLALAWREMGLIDGPISTVFHAHELAGLSDRQGRQLYGPLFGSDMLLLPISERWRDRLVRWGAKPERTIIHHMGVDTGRFDFSPHLPAADAAIDILSVGRLTEQKGYEFAIRAVAHLRPLTGRTLRYTIIGEGELEVQLRELVAELGISDMVTFAGPQPQNVVSAHLQAAHIFLLPSVTAANGFQEGIPVALMEAMASGLPVVTTRHSGIPELVEHGVSGFLAEEREIEALADHMLAIISKPAQAKEIAANARQKIEDDFQIHKLNSGLARIFARQQAALAS